MSLQFVNGRLCTVTAKTSLFRGVHWCSSKQMWRVEIEVRGKKHKLGRHHIEHMAAHAYDAAAIQFGVPERCNAWWAYTVEISHHPKKRAGKSQMRRARL